MAKITPVLPHIAMTMAVDEANSLILCLDTLIAWAGDDVPELVVAFTAELSKSVEQLERALEPEEAEVEDDGLAAA